ncbi:MAG: phosphate--AMP phosphotransferase [Candidatus Aureabacteria bacterium]|nr:phosphate--AMP phosphotransferase [Candidatus Auribacterota bacterium]
MLEKVDLSRKLKKEAFKKAMSSLELKIGELQRLARSLNIPVIVVFEGWDAAGKGTLINKLLLSLDPRGFTVHPTNPPNEEERLRPFLWRFWTRTPGKGRIAIFDRSWYGRVLVERVDKLIKKKDWLRSYEEINSFEKQLSDDGTVIIKFFLHISKKEQKKRFKKLLSNSSTSWKVTKEDWRHHRQYKKYYQATEDMLAETDTSHAPWTVIEAHDRRHATARIFHTFVRVIEQKIESLSKSVKKKSRLKRSAVMLRSMTESILDKSDLSLSLTRSEYEKELKKYQEKIRNLEHDIYMKRVPVIVIYQGWDAAGKGGNIKRLIQGMDPRGYEVVPIAAPNDIEKSHHYLWRFWTKIPKAGHIHIFDRSWYGRVLVEKVENFCSEDEWKRAYREINEMEHHLANFGTAIIKFWLHIDPDEQLRRFRSREKTPHKKWKITDEDWRNRKKWKDYKQAVDEMLFRTSTPHAPWTIVEANSKLYARIKVLRTFVDVLEKRLRQ